MGAGRGYDIFPRTFKARLLLALAFLGGLSLLTGWVALLALGDYGVSGLYELPPCSGSQREDCLEAQTELLPNSQASCEGTERRVCFVPLGQVDPELVRHLVDYYYETYGLEIGVLTPRAVPADLVDPVRQQIDGATLAEYIGTLYPRDFETPGVGLIGLTPLDLYATDRDWRFQMGFAAWGLVSHGVVSSYRMHLGGFGLVDEGVWLERVRKMVTKYIGLMVYQLPLSERPESPMFGGILSVGDLDVMREPLPVEDVR